jgi:Nis1 family
MWINSFSALAILAASLLTPTEAIITRISAPTTTLHPGHKFTVTFFTEDHIINNAQYYALFGVTPSTKPEQVMGTLLNEGFDLVTSGHSQTGHGSFKVTVPIPKGFVTESGKTEAYVLNTAVFGTVCVGGIHRFTEVRAEYMTCKFHRRVQ